MRIGFWKTNRDRFFTSHQAGLNVEQIQELQKLKVGDRLAIWQNETDGNSPNMTLKILEETKPNG